MVDLTTIDFIFIGAYFFVLILIGYFSSRKQKDEDYLIANRKLGSWSTMATLNASKTGSILMIFVALVYVWGFSAMWYFIGMVLGVLAFLPFALRLKDKSRKKYYTLADYFKHNFGKKSAVFVSLITIVLMFGFLVMNLIAGTKIFVFFTSWPFWLCAGIMVFIVLLYLLMGGFKAVVKTDILQYIAIVAILGLLALILFKGSIIPGSEWSLLNVDLVTVVGFFIAGFLFPFAMPDMWQRVYSSRDKKSLRNGLLLSALVYFVVALLLALVALTVKIKFPGVDPDLALIHGFANLLPAGLLGLGVVLLFAAIMSSIDTYVFTSSSAIIQDFFNFDKKRAVRNIRKIIFVVALLGTLVAIAIQDLIIGAFIFVAISTFLAVSVLASWFKKTITQRTLLFGLTFGALGFVGYLIPKLIQGDIQPMIVIVALGSSILGLIVGGIVSWIKK
jgi:solute:Na+ symporter, SSS family